MNDIKQILDKTLNQSIDKAFIKNDPVCIPHQFTKKQDIEIAGLFAALFAWGNRKTVIQKSNELMDMMDNEPFAFVSGHQPADLKPLLHFKHRTFNSTDLLYFIQFLRQHYQHHHSLETAFSKGMKKNDPDVANGLIYFRNYFVSFPDFPKRTSKHISTPANHSACKRLNMFLRWMVRKDDEGIDFGIWKSINPGQLICPLDVHVNRAARQLGLIQRKQSDWKAAVELTEALRAFDPEDPVKYDLALFELGRLNRKFAL
jgi:uncharacterized protein (TIGR02757 family)